VTADELNKCKAPILFIHGAKESQYTQDRVAAIRKMLGRGELKVIDGADHVSTLAKPEFGTTIVEFLRTGKIK